MALITVLSQDPAVSTQLVAGRGPMSVAVTRSWERLLWLVRERPVTDVVLDSAALPSRDMDISVGDLKRRFPSVGIVFLYRHELDPMTLLQLGQAGISGLTLARYEHLSDGLRRGLAASARRSTSGLVQRALGARVVARERQVVRSALEGVALGWRTDDLAAAAGWTRAHLSTLLKSQGLPSAGHLLLWARLLHAGRWLTEPGRTAGSVSRQLEYANGATFRRALRNYLGETPGSLIEAGGFSVVLSRFLDVCGLRGSVQDSRSVA
jgi:AraC-like DNA-binding protein